MRISKTTGASEMPIVKSLFSSCDGDMYAISIWLARTVLEIRFLQKYFLIIEKRIFETVGASEMPIAYVINSRWKEGFDYRYLASTFCFEDTLFII